MNYWIQRASLILILLVAAALRMSGIDWDNYDHHHPDERYITWVATTIEWPDDWSTAFSPTDSTFNPYFWPKDAASDGIEVLKDEPRKYAYGHLPLYLGTAATRLAERAGETWAPLLPSSWLFTTDVLNATDLVEYRHLTAVARLLTALVDVGTVWLIFLLGRHLYGPAVGLLASSFLALNVMHVQLSHFFTADPYMTFFVVASVYLMVRGVVPKRGSVEGSLSSRRSLLFLHLAAAAAGLAVGSKFAAILLVLPLLAAVYLSVKRRLGWTLLTLGATLALAFIITNPFALLDNSCEVVTPSAVIGPISIPAINWGSCFLDNIGTQGAMVRGDLDLPFTRQYRGTAPFLYFAEMQLRWGMGPILGLLAFLGFGWIAWQTMRRLDLRRWRLGVAAVAAEAEPGSVILLAWALPFFLSTGSFYVKFMRYLMPLTPFLMLFAAAMLWQWRQQRWRSAVVGLALIATALYALSFVNMYQTAHPWAAASQWIYANVSPGATILSEQWDDALPVSLLVDGQSRRRSEFQDMQLTWLSKTADHDDAAKLDANLERLAAADYLTVVSNRIYGVVPRLPDEYPISSQYHQLLFDGALGYEAAAVFGRFPNVGNFAMKPDYFEWPGLRPPSLVERFLDGTPGVNWGRVDESFTVYDQPLTILFENVGKKSAEEMRLLFAVD